MITRDLIMTVNNSTASLNEPLFIYQHDRGITLKIKVQKYKFMFDKLVEEDVVVDSSIISARAIVRKPDGVSVFECPRENVEDDCVIINITKDWTDEQIEVGKYLLQLQLYGSDYVNERITMPPVEFTVVPLIGFIAEQGVAIDTVGYAQADISYLTTEGTALADDIENNIYNKTVWHVGDTITSARLNKVEDTVEYLVQNKHDDTYFTPSMDALGNLSWSNNGALPNPATINVMGPTGPTGPKGDTGRAFTYNDLTAAQKADLTQDFITCSGITRIELVTDYPATEEAGVLYIKVSE